jgi:hypothetical protein
MVNLSLRRRDTHKDEWNSYIQAKKLRIWIFQMRFYRLSLQRRKITASMVRLERKCYNCWIGANNVKQENPVHLRVS